MKFLAWSPTRVADYDTCPALARWKHLAKLCTVCFKGRTKGGYDSPAVCDTCGVKIPIAAPLEKGKRIDTEIEAYLNGASLNTPVEARNKECLLLMDEVRSLVAGKQARPQVSIALTRKWEACDNWDPDCWFRAKLDVLILEGPHARVVDWKTGGVDKKTGGVKSSGKYDDQLEFYALAVMCAFPEVQTTEAALAFVEASAGAKGVVRRGCGTLRREDVEMVKERWTRRVTAYEKDTEFSPKAGMPCRWCDYSSAKGGPCPLGVTP